MSDQPLLLRALRLNSIFSASSALVLLLAGPWIAAQLGLTIVTPVYATAGLLAVFALRLGHIVRSRDIKTTEIAVIIVSDIAWVIGSAVLVGLFYSSLTTIGLLLVDMVAIAVGYFAIQQIRGLRAWRRDAAA